MDLSPFAPSRPAVAASSQLPMGAGVPIEDDAAAVELAIYDLARAAALSGVYYSDLAGLWPNGVPETSLGRLVAKPISQACLHAQVVLVQRLESLLGRAEAGARLARIQARVFAEIERPLALADVTFH